MHIACLLPHSISLSLSLSTYTTSTVKRDACPLCCEDFKKCGSDTVEADKGIEDCKKLPDADKGTESKSQGRAEKAVICLQYKHGNGDVDYM